MLPFCEKTSFFSIRCLPNSISLRDIVWGRLTHLKIYLAKSGNTSLLSFLKLSISNMKTKVSILISLLCENTERRTPVYLFRKSEFSERQQNIFSVNLQCINGKKPYCSSSLSIFNLLLLEGIIFLVSAG